MTDDEVVALVEWEVKITGGRLSMLGGPTIRLSGLGWPCCAAWKKGALFRYLIQRRSI